MRTPKSFYIDVVLGNVAGHTYLGASLEGLSGVTTVKMHRRVITDILLCSGHLVHSGTSNINVVCKGVI